MTAINLLNHIGPWCGTQTKNLISPLPENGKVLEIVKRVGIVVSAIIWIIGLVYNACHACWAHRIDPNANISIPRRPLIPPRSAEIGPAGSRLIGIDPSATEALQGAQLEINLRAGTPGVNLAGLDETDRNYVTTRVQTIRREIGPHAHTVGSLRAYQERIQQITFQALGGERNITIDQVIDSHQINKATMMHKFGKQLTMSVIGAGPIGLAASIAFYKLGFKVTCYEKRNAGGDDGYVERLHPFSLMRQSYWLLSSLGFSFGSLLQAFGSPVTADELNQEGGGDNPFAQGAAEFNKIQSPIMKHAKQECIGSCAKDYIPQNMSLPVGLVQHNLAQMIFGRIHTRDREELEVICNAECLRSESAPNGRRTLHIGQKKLAEISISPDAIYNATGGRINNLLGFPTNQIATYYGMGAFFPRPPQATHQNPPKLLSRAVRVFCSYNPEQPVYCNVELTKEEFDAMENTPPQDLMQKVMHDVGLPQPPTKAFKVQIDLKHVQKAATIGTEQIPQLIFCGGDSILQPHFITASGANFGLLGLIELERLITAWMQDQITSQEVVSHYNDMASLLQKQSCQVIMELFGRDLVY